MRELIHKGLVSKTTQGYELTDYGKEYVSTIDDERFHIEKQPKTSVLIRGVRMRGELLETLCMKRLKEPYYGKVGKIGGKVQFGESLADAARRELEEETGLLAMNPTLEKIYHKVRYNKDGKVVQDVIFYQFHVSEFVGEFKSEHHAQLNMWLTEEEVGSGKHDLFDDFEFENSFEAFELHYLEHFATAEGF